MHVPTMLAMIILASAVMSVAIAIVARNRHPDLQAWARALGLQLLGYLVLALRPHMPETVSIVLGNALLSASLSMYGYGLYRFFREPPNWTWLVWPVVTTGVVCLVWLTDFRWRVGALSWVYAVQGTVMLGLLWRHRTSQTGRRGQYLLGLGVVMFIAVMLIRVGLAWLNWLDITQNQQSGLFNTLTYMNTLACTMMLSVGILMMTQERAEALRSESRRSSVADSVSIRYGTSSSCVIPRREKKASKRMRSCAACWSIRYKIPVRSTARKVPSTCPRYRKSAGAWAGV